MFGRSKKPARQMAMPQRSTKPIFSYYSKRSSNDRTGGRRMDQQAAQRLHGSAWWHHLPSFIALAAISLSLIYALGVDANPRIIQPTSNSSKFLRDKTTYQKATQRLIKSSVLNGNKITLNTSSVARELRRQFPELTDVTITVPLIGRRPVVYLQPATPALIIKSRNGSYMLDKTGKAIIAIDQVKYPSELRLLTVDDKSGPKVKLGEGILPGDSVAFVTTVNGQLLAQKIIPSSLVLPLIANQLDVRIIGKPYVIRMNLQNDAKQQIGAFLAAKQRLESDNQEPSEYFDTRVEERVYYK